MVRNPDRVESHGLGGDTLGSVQYADSRGRRRDLAPDTLAKLDIRTAEIIEEQRLRAARIIHDRQAMVETLRDLLLEKKTLDRSALAALKGA